MLLRVDPLDLMYMANFGPFTSVGLLCAELQMVGKRRTCLSLLSLKGFFLFGPL